MFSANEKKDFYRECNSRWFFRLPRLRGHDFASQELRGFTVISGMYDAMFNAEAQATHRLRWTPTGRKNLFARWAESRGARVSRSVRRAARASALQGHSRSNSRNWSTNRAALRIDRRVSDPYGPLPFRQQRPAGRSVPSQP